MKHYPCPKCSTGHLVRGPKTATGKTRWRCELTVNKVKTVCYQTTDPLAPVRGRNAPVALPKVFNLDVKGKHTFIITAAQNATALHDGFWRSLKHAARRYDAQLIVHALRYKNPTTRQEAEDTLPDEWWSPQVEDYLCNTRLQLHRKLAFLGDIKIQPTAVEPLTGLEGFTGSESTIVGHTKLSFRTVATPGHAMAKMMTTTGAVTKRNYSDTRAGKMGSFHHTLGAVLVEIDGPFFWLRHLNANNKGEFTDLRIRFTPNGPRRAPRPAAVAFGDIHHGFIDPGVAAATWGHNGLMETLKPRNAVYHDLLDGYAGNPHHIGNAFNKIAKQRSGMDSVEREVRGAIKWAKNMTPPWCKGWIVDSNHDRFLTRWAINTDWRSDPVNAEFCLETQLAMVKSTKMGAGGTEYISPFPYWVSKYKIKNVKCTGADGLRIAGIEMGQHGDRGPNGARGSIKNLRRIGAKVVIGHSHSPGISEGAYQTGTSSLLKLEYNSGPSSWLHTHCLVHADGKRQLITIINGRFKR